MIVLTEQGTNLIEARIVSPKVNKTRVNTVVANGLNSVSHHLEKRIIIPELNSISRPFTSRDEQRKEI